MTSVELFPDGGLRRNVIGLDVGASGVRAWSVEPGPYGSAQLVDPGAERSFASAPFAPLPVADQLDQIARGLLKVSAEEVKSGTARVKLAAECVRAIAERSDVSSPIVLGIAAAGMKTRDKTGICAARNGPRIPDYLDRLAEELDGVGFEVFPTELWSDGDCAGFGERTGGSLADVNHAYYLGGGTGLAESLVLDGSVVLLDEGLDWFPKAWQLEREPGVTFEAELGLQGLNARWGAVAGSGAPAHPERAAAAGDAGAVQLLGHAAERLADLLEARIRGVDEQGRVLERIVLGQRFALWFGARGVGNVEPALFREPLESALAARLGSDQRLAREYLVDGRLRSSFLRASELRAAPALGAAVRAVVARGDAAGAALE